MISEDFYKRYSLFLSSNPLFPRYIRWVYEKTVKDFERTDILPSFTKENFTALLCGTCGEITSGIFVDHILKFNSRGRIIILDYGEAQVNHSKVYISTKFPDADVSYIVADARQSGIPNASVDFIDTDFMFEYLDEQSLDQLFVEWKRILAPGGCVAFRAFGTGSWFSELIYRLFIKSFCKLILKSDIYSHTLVSIEETMKKNGFEYFIAGKAFLPFGYRFVAKIKNT